MYDIYQNIGLRISRLRKEHKITQEKLAEELDISVKHMSSVERGISSLSLEKLIQVSKIFDCTLDYLILGKSEPDLNMIPESIISVFSSRNEQEIQILLEYLRLYNKIKTCAVSTSQAPEI